MRRGNSRLYYLDFSSTDLELGGSALAQVLNRLGATAPTVSSAERFAKAFGTSSPRTPPWSCR